MFQRDSNLFLTRNRCSSYSHECKKHAINVVFTYHGSDFFVIIGIRREKKMNFLLLAGLLVIESCINWLGCLYGFLS
jgi:hypothetical protein